MILDSNGVKNNAFRAVLSDYSNELVESFIEYHMANGGISRHEKFKYFLTNLAQNYSDDRYLQLLNAFGEYCRSALLSAPLTCGAKGFVEKYSREVDLFVLSGGDQIELRQIFSARGLACYFVDILGSPVSKVEHLDSLVREGRLDGRTLFVGDSLVDHRVATETSVEFAFISSYTDFEDWRSYCEEENIRVWANLRDMEKSDFLHD